MARSTLELLLDSIKDRDEEPPDRLPALPQRPTSRGRLPSRKRTPALFLAQSSSEGPYEHSPRQLLSASDGLNLQSNGHKKPDAHFALTHEGNRAVYENGNGKKAANGDQIPVDNIPVKVEKSVIEERMLYGKKENKHTDSGDSTEETCHFHQPAPSSTYVSLSKRRKVHHLYGLQKDSHVWLLNKENSWVLGFVQSYDKSTSVLCKFDGQLIDVPIARLLPANPEFLNEVDDLVQLSYVHEPAIFHVLRQRYEHGAYCTRAGSLLIKISLLNGSSDKSVPYSYNQNMEFLNLMEGGSQEPQFQKLLDEVYCCMTKGQKSQSIIIGGECSAGKRESMHAVLQHLVCRGNNPDLGNSILISNLVLEAFVNANAANNTTISQSGRLVDVIFDKEGKTCGANIRLVFFDKLRVACDTGTEHTYHIFSQLFEGADVSLREKLGFKEASEFKYLKQNACVNGAHPHLNLQLLLKALNLLGFTEKNIRGILSLLGAILWLGNITSIGLNNYEAIDNAARLLNCSKEALSKALVLESSDPQDVCDARNVIAFTIYENLVNWLLAHINTVLKPKTLDPDSLFITVVDMPAPGGVKGGLGGLLANYAQEHLQQFTRRHLLQHGEEVVACGGLRSCITGSPLNDENINFLEYELLPFLVSHEARNVQELESGFKQNLERLVTGSTCCKQSLSCNDLLTVYHTFGEITYNVRDFVKEMKASHSPFLPVLNSAFTELLDTSTMFETGYSWKSHYQGLPSQGHLAASQEEVLQVMQCLEDREPHFIFCMAPRETLPTQSKTLQQGYVIRQLRINKINDVVRLCRSGKYVGIPHQQFASRFGSLLQSYAKKVNNPLDISVAVLQHMGVPSYAYEMGWTKIFIFHETIEKLECAQEQLMIKAVKIQKTFRGYKLRKQLKRWRIAATLLQASVRGWLARKRSSQESQQMTQIASSPHEVTTELVKNEVWLSKDSSKCRDSLEKRKVDATPNTLSADERKEENIQPEAEKNLQVKDFGGDVENSQLVMAISEKLFMNPSDAAVELKRKDEEITVLQQTVKEYERKWSDYELKMKAMEEMWQKQVSLLEKRLSAATKGSNTEDSAYKTGDSDKGLILSTQPQCASARDTSDTASADRDVVVPKNDVDPGRSVLEHLNKELDHRTQVFNDDARFLVEVKSGQIEANFKPDEELRKLKQRFEVWKKDYKARLKETKGMLKKLGKPDSGEKSKKRWWSKN
ncbi:hypothetical protein KP509_08G044300 [Ceratopteris richardii]|uniref:Myosin motor domain-containing protein n=3 Tax=Ceratopteris richardii TaxID=49495 RepID=A0A8T2U7L3_CERRI|nr:hypothetical protein KP509_08G044300 [Ceratopteris richardii]